MEDKVSRRTVRGLKLHGQRAQAAVTGQAKRWVVVEYLPVQVDADVRSHVFGTDGENLEVRQSRCYLLIKSAEGVSTSYKTITGET